MKEEMGRREGKVRRSWRGSGWSGVGVGIYLGTSGLVGRGQGMWVGDRRRRYDAMMPRRLRLPSSATKRSSSWTRPVDSENIQSKR